MIYMKKNRRSDCPISFAMDTFGDKWSLLIIRDMMFNGKKYYGEFVEADEKISTNILADRLLTLEAEGIIAKDRDTNNLSKYQYSLTSKGLDLLPMLLDIISWSAKYDANTGISKGFVRKLNENRDALIKETLNSLNTK